MKFNLITQLDTAINFLVVNNKKTVNIDFDKKMRTNPQNAARWLYLEMIASILNERGDTFNAPNTKIQVPYTKDNLYHIYWQGLRLNMYPNKKKQLNTDEFSKLVDMVLMMFAQRFDISINFPSIEYK